MDAISFVLGERTRHLRVTRLSDLIHGSVVGKPVAKTASVTAVYEMPDATERRFSRYISGNTSEYRIDGTPVKVDEYAEALEKIHIFMKVKNFLIFQGAVESIAMKNARERCQMFEEISRSAELKDEYDRSKSEMQKLEEEAAFNLNKKKNIVAERKEARIEIDEAEKYRRLNNDLLSKRTELHLFRLYYNEVDTKHIREELKLREEQIEKENAHRQNLEEEIREKRRELGKLHRDQAGIEQEIKKCEQKISKKKPEYIKVSQLLRHVNDKHKESKKSLENARQLHSSHRQEMDQLSAEYARILELKEEYERQQNKKSQEQGRSLELEDSQLAEYHRLKQKVAEHTSHLSAQLDSLSREYDEQKDLSDALERRKEEIENSLRLKQTELNDNQKRLQKLTEFIESSHRSIAELTETEKSISEEVEMAARRIEEINAELESVICQIGEAKVERHESSRAAKKQELIENLKRLFAGVLLCQLPPPLVDLACKIIVNPPSLLREYEDRELRIARERDRKRLEFNNQLQRINNQLEYEKSRDTQANVHRWEETVTGERSEMERCKKQEKRLKEEMEVEEARKADLEAQLTEFQQKNEQLEGELGELRRRLVSRQREVQKQQKDLNQIENRLENKRSERHSLLQSAKMDDLQLPLKPGASSMPELESQLVAESEGADLNSEEMMRLYEMEAKLPLDYKQLDKPLRMIADEKEVNRKADEMQNDIDRMANNLARIQAPNLRASAKLGNVEQRLRSTEAEFEETRRKAKRARAQFERIRRLRYNAFMNCFNSIADNIDPLYKSLSRNPGAQASLLPTNAEEPYLEDLQFQCVAPGKRFQQMDSLSGGEKTIAALALSFAMHQYNPSPFFVLDEIDAALDNTNIGKVASFIREYSRTRAQVIVISLKEEFYSRADSLIGIYPDIENNCLVSRVLTFDLSKYVDTEDQ
nr:unnamed protein product [Spirometra erinaceieuropaei]